MTSVYSELKLKLESAELENKELNLEIALLKRRCEQLENKNLTLQDKNKKLKIHNLYYNFYKGSYGKFFFLLEQKKHKLKGKTRLFNQN